MLNDQLESAPFFIYKLMFYLSTLGPVFDDGDGGVHLPGVGVGGGADAVVTLLKEGELRHQQ